MRVPSFLILALALTAAGHDGAYAQGAGNGAATAKTLRLSAVLPGVSSPVQPGEVTLLDNGRPATLRSWKQAATSGDPVSVILVIDDVNARLTTIAYERDELKKYFTRGNAQLPAPFNIVIMSDTNLQAQKGFSANGKEENEALQSFNIGLHEFGRNALDGRQDLTNVSVRYLEQLMAYAAKIPGRKLILFVSPGWPLLSGARVNLSGKEENGILAEVAHLQDTMLRNNITLDMLNPFGPAESILREDFYQDFLKGVSRPSDVDIADLSLQVLAVHSGGAVQQGSSDIAGMVEKTMAELGQTYQMEFIPSPSERPNEYHHLELKVNRPGVKPRIPDEYYAEPAAIR